MSHMNRRTFLKGAALLGGSSAVLGLMGCAPQGPGTTKASAAAGNTSGIPSFMIAPRTYHRLR